MVLKALRLSYRISLPVSCGQTGRLLQFDIARPKLTIRYGQARAVWRFPLLRVERTWLGRGSRPEFDPKRTLRVIPPEFSIDLAAW